MLWGVSFVLPILLAIACLMSPGWALAQDSALAPEILPGYATQHFIDDLDVLRKRKVIRALVTPGKSDFFIVEGRPRGLQAAFLREYEKYLNAGVEYDELRVRVVYIPVAFSELIPALIEGRGDIAAGMLTITPKRQKLVAFASGRGRAVSEVVVARRGVPAPSSVDDLSGRNVYVLRGSSYVEHLQALSRRLEDSGLDPIVIEEADARLRSEDIMELLNAGVVDLTVVDDYKARMWANVLPEMIVLDALKVHSGGYLGWAIRKNNPQLLESVQAFVQTVRKGTLTGNVLWKRYMETTKWIRNPVEEEERARLGRFVSMFRKYGELYGFDYLALAAQAYQESRLDPGRRSTHGAVGIMQLLPSTAADPNVGISDIGEVENNIHAGAKYLAFLRDRYFSATELDEEDRLAFSWAAYNAGPARVRQMRDTALATGLDPDRWFQNVEYAALELVGQETVRYVANVYKYYVAYRLKQDFLEALVDEVAQ
jgi:membrane-bound lytic murein transglycosylase MltF